MTQKAHRDQLIRKIEEHRESRVISYIVGDRPNNTAQISEDAVRPMYDHLLEIGQVPNIDLFLYSIGGLTEVPWRIVSMIREFVSERFSVIIPYKAMSAATMIAMGADEILIGRKGELGPIDPTLSISRGSVDGTVVQDQVAVEDIMSYIRFVKATGLSDQSALAPLLMQLADKLDPKILGQLDRAHSHIRDVGRKLLTSRADDYRLEAAIVDQIIDALSETTYQHGHAIGRKEARQIGLKVQQPDAEMEKVMWDLYVSYEELLRLRTPLDPRISIPNGENIYEERLDMAVIESVGSLNTFRATVRFQNQRVMPPQLQVNTNVNLQLPPNLSPDELPSETQAALNGLIQQFQEQSQQIVQAEVERQMPVVGVQGDTFGTAWERG